MLKFLQKILGKNQLFNREKVVESVPDVMLVQKYSKLKYSEVQIQSDNIKSVNKLIAVQVFLYTFVIVLIAAVIMWGGVRGSSDRDIVDTNRRSTIAQAA